MRPLKITTLAMVSCAALFAGCGEKEDTTESSASAETTEVPSAPKPEVSFVTPKDGSAVSGALLCKVKLEDFTIDPKAVGQSPQPGRGHLHFEMDGGKFDLPKYSGENGKMAVALKVDGKYSPALTRDITYKNLPKGKHVVVVYLANNNHTNIGPDADAEAEVVVK